MALRSQLFIVFLFACTLLRAQDAYVVAEHDDGSPSIIVYIKGTDEKVKEEGYYENGNLEYVGNYKDGKEHGEFLYYYEDGTLQYEENWKNGLEHGTTKEYAPDGQLVLEQEWKNGNLVEEIVHQ